jgi:hypothetical protein
MPHGKWYLDDAIEGLGRPLGVIEVAFGLGGPVPYHSHTRSFIMHKKFVHPEPFGLIG